MPNTSVSGMAPNNLKATQKSVDCVRQTISFRIAIAKKKTAQRIVSLRQPSAVRLKTDLEQDGDEGTAEQQSTGENGAEQRVDHGRLDLDEGLVVQHQCQRSEHGYDHCRDDGHHRQMPRENPRCHERDGDSRHEDRGGREDAEARIGEEEHNQRPEIERELEERTEGGPGRRLRHS